MENDPNVVEKWRQENERLLAYINRMASNQREREKHDSRVYILSVMGAVCSGFVLAIFASPAPVSKGDCGVFKVNEKTVTSFVLKPPPSPAAEPAVCPVAPKCEAQPTSLPETDSKANQTNADEAKPKRHRHRRYRAYWR